jgi:hypothetical protein
LDKIQTDQMKRLLLSALVLISVSLSAQQVPNYNFDCWNSFPGPPAYEEPCGWTSYNSFSAQGYPVFVYKTTDAHSDSFAIEVRTMGYTNPFPPYNPLVDIGLAQTGTNYQNGPNGFPLPPNTRPQMFSAWVKYLPQGVDSAEVKIKLYKWNVTFQQPQDVAHATFYVSSTDADYHCVTKTFTYVPPFTTSGFPDTASVYITSSFQNNTTAGSIVRVDDISFGNCIVSTEETPRAPEMTFYPNPADDNIRFTWLPASADRIKIFETTGKMVAAEAVNNSFAWIDLKSLTPGIYLFGVYDENNKVVSSGKFSIVR